MADEKAVSPPGNREGFLWKRGRDNAQFLRRRFVLLSREGLLKYYTKEEVSGQAAWVFSGALGSALARMMFSCLSLATVNPVHQQPHFGHSKVILVWSISLLLFSRFLGFCLFVCLFFLFEVEERKIDRTVAQAGL